jgi:type II secretory pathway pseudopilin PulG
VTLIALMAAVCLVLLVLGFLVPRLSRRPQRSVDRALGVGARTGARAPGRLGRWLSRPFSLSERAADKSASAGRRSRRKLPI